jgi:hypothetical protein
METNRSYRMGCEGTMKWVLIWYSHTEYTEILLHGFQMGRGRMKDDDEVVENN